MHIIQSTVALMNMVKISQSLQSIYIEQSQIDLLESCQFSFCGSVDIIYGGAIFIENSNLTMQNTFFESNIGQNGGAISINCDNYDS